MMQKMTNEQYAEYVKRKSPPSPLWGDLLKAFLIGGAICVIGELVTQLWLYAGLERVDASTACSMTLVFLGALLTGLGVYDDIAKFGGAGTLVPITGFANRSRNSVWRIRKYRLRARALSALGKNPLFKSSGLRYTCFT